MKNQLKYLFFTTLLTFCLVVVAKAEEPPKPTIPGDWVPIPELTDEFDSYDSQKWSDQDSKWAGRFPSYFEQGNTNTKNGNLLLISRDVGSNNPPSSSEGTYTHAAAVLKSTTMVKYGYFETKSKSSGSELWWNSFWLYDYVPGEHKEIDIFEIVASHDYIVTNYLVFESVEYGIVKDDTASKVGIFTQSFKDTTAGDYHIYGLDWNKDSVTTYIDGVKFQSIKNEYWHQKMYLVFSTQINPEWPGVPAATSAIDSFNIEYVRSWKDKNATSIDNPSLRLDKSGIYPNPSSGVFNLNFSSAYKGDVSVKIFSIDGRQINELRLQKNENELNQQIDLSEQDIGVYLIQIEAGEYHSNHKIIIN